MSESYCQMYINECVFRFILYKIWFKSKQVVGYTEGTLACYLDNTADYM